MTTEASEALWSVAERTRALESLRTSEERLRLFVEHAPAAVAMFDLEMRYLVVSRRFVSDYRLGDQPLLGRSHYEVFPELPERLKEVHRRCLAGAVEACDDDPFLRLDGTVEWVRWEVRPWRTPAGAIGGVILFSERVTAQKQAEERLAAERERLARSEHRYRLLADHAHDVIWTLDLATRRYTYVSPSVLSLRGLTADEALREPIEESLTEESLARVVSVMGLIGTPAEEDPHTGLYDQPCRDGTIKHVEITTTLVRDGQGRPVEVVGVSRDATARVRAERALEEREHKLRAILETTLDGFWVNDAEGRLLDVNAAYCAMSGYTRGELLQMRIAQLEASEAPAETAAHVARVAQQGSDRFETRHRRKDGQHIELEASVSHLAQYGSFICFFRDITERKRAEAQTKKLTEQLQQAQRLESIGRLAGGVAHDFNNLLTVILSCSEELKGSLARQWPQGLEDVEQIEAAGERARDLTRQLLAFARKQVIAPVPLDLNAVVQGSQRMLARLLGEDIALDVTLQPGLWTTHADLGQLEQIIVNLAVNARDAMPRGGRLAIETRNRSVSPPVAGDEAHVATGEWVELVVRDSGAGIPPEVKAHLFEPFFTTKEVGKGTGLGLATVYGIVMQAGGRIRVESEPGLGTTFELSLPRSALAAVGPDARESSRGAVTGTEAVLVVEDDALVREVAVRALQGAGYEVLTAADAQAALDLPPELLSRLRLVVTDVVMRGLDGRELAIALGRRLPTLRVLYISGYTGDVVSERGVLESGGRFLEKPFTGPALLAKVRAVLDAP